MAERAPDSHPSAIDVLDRVLDKGIVIDGWGKISIGGIHLISIDGRFVVASIETYLRHAPVVEQTSGFAWPELETVHWSPPEPPPTPAPKKRRVRAR